MQKIVFCFPYRGVGGVSLLFLRMAEALVAQGGVDAYLVDYADGFMAKHRSEGLTHLIEYRDNAKVYLPGDAIAVFQSMTPWSIYPSLQFPPEIRILFWNCHPFNLIPTLPGLRQFMQRNTIFGRFFLATILRSYRNKMVKLIDLMLARQSLVFMDTGNVSVTECYLGISIPKPVFLPIPAASGAGATPKNRDYQTNGLRVAWVGRVVDFKYHVLKYALIRLDRLQPELGFPINVTVVGSGEYDGRLCEDAAALRQLPVHFVDHIPPSQLETFLRDKVDILLAMGMSALEGATMGIPTILLDVCYGEVPDGYVFQWLHERSGFSLGDLLGPQHILPGNHSLIERIGEAVSDYPGVARRTAAYVERFHSLEVVATTLHTIADEARCTHSDMVLAGITGRGLIYSAFTTLRKVLSERGSYFSR